MGGTNNAEFRSDPAVASELKLAEPLPVLDLEKQQRRKPSDPPLARSGEFKDPDTGRPAYEPRTLLKLLLHGYDTGTFTSRKLAQKAREDILTMWLVAQERPDFRTISDFRKAYLPEIADFFV